MKLPLSPITKGIIVSAAGGMILLHGSGFSPNSVDAQQKSSIQQELDKLYQEQGRQAPDMRVNSLPNETIDGRVFQQGAPGQLPTATQTHKAGLQYDPSLLSTNRIPAPPQYRRKKSLLDRLMFWKKDKPVPRQVTQPTPAPRQSPQTTQPSTSAARPAAIPSTTRKERAVSPLAPPADLPYQRPVTQSPKPFPPAPSSQPVTLELPMKESVETPEPSLPKWNPEPKPLRQPVAQPQPVRKPIISAQPGPGKMPVIIPKAPPVESDSPAANRVIVSPDGFKDSNDKSAALPELDDADDLALPSSPRPNPLTASEELPVAQPEPLKGPRPMPEDANTDPFAQQPDAAQEAPAAIVEQPQEAESPLPAATLPNLDELPKEPLPIMGEEEKPIAAEPPMKDVAFPDPFTDVSEREADSDKTDMTIPDIQMNDGPAAAVPSEGNTDISPEENAAAQRPPVPAEEPSADAAAQPIPEDENPFSGLKLDEPESPAPPLEVEPGAAATLPLNADDEGAGGNIEAPAAAPSLPDIDPAFDDNFKLPVKKDTSEEPMPEQPILEKIPESPLPELPAADEGDISWEEEQARREAKLALIAAREGETGMKGFCIVELRDHRDLVDAVPAFRSTYNLRTYHFSSLEAKIEFDKAPRKYVPAYDGNDPILLSTQSEEREGSLDYALWFKGRLYLFTSRENLEVFQADPVLYSEN